MTLPSSDSNTQMSLDKKDMCPCNVVYKLSFCSAAHTSSILNFMTNPFSPSKNPFTEQRTIP